MTRNQEYWKKRAEATADLEFKKVDDYILRMDLEYKEALYSLQKNIEVFYMRFAQNNEISYSEATKLLNSNQLQEFKMDLAEFTKKAKNNKNLQWEKELVNVSLKVRITRLEALQTRIENAIEDLYYQQQEEGTQLLNNTYEDTYYRNIYNIQTGTGIGVDFAKPDSAALDNAVNERWLEGNYSSRLWKDKLSLLAELETGLKQAFIRGDSIDKTTKTVAAKLGSDFNKTRTLINTESAYIAQKATFDGYKANGVDKYQIVATLDLHTSKICKDMDHKGRSKDEPFFYVNEYEIGVTAPPFHPNCRTTTVAYFEGMMFGERIARDNEGKTYYVDRNMTYQEWYDKYVKGNPKEETAEKKVKNKSSDKKQYEKYKEVLGSEASKSFDKFQELKYNNSNEWGNLKNSYAETNRFNKIVKESSDSHIKGQVIKNIDRIDISDYKFAETHINSERNHNVTKEMAQEYINEAVVAYSRWSGDVTVYLAESGCSVVNLKDKIISTAYKSKEYDKKFKKILEVIDND